MYSVVAGFVEPGESLEECVIREVKEETGVLVKDVVYQASQPWPFPSSLMLGFNAKATTTEFNPDDDELDDIRWVTREGLKPWRNGRRNAWPEVTEPTLHRSDAA